MNQRAPLSPAELAKRVELATASAARIGAVHQAEPAPIEVVTVDPPRVSAADRFLAECPIDEWIITSTGLRRWRAIFDDVSVSRLPNGVRILNLGRFELRLDAERAQHISRLLSDESV